MTSRQQLGQSKRWVVKVGSSLVTNDGREGREVGIVDPDGNLVVIYHITSTPA